MTIESMANSLPSTYETEKTISIINNSLIGIEPENKLKYLVKWTVAIALRNTIDNTGGPFGALLWDAQNQRVVAIGANHVVPETNPTRHAEMVCYDDYQQRTGSTDLNNLTVVTSCECCPQCYATAIAYGAKEIYFGATAERAAKSDFSDAEMWNFIGRGYDANAFDITESPDMVKYSKALGRNEACLVLPDEKIISADKRDSLGYTSLPIVRLVIDGIKQTGRMFDLPEGSVIISRNKPHPESIFASHWANVGFEHERDKIVPPAAKKPHLLYLDDEEEVMNVSGRNVPAVEVLEAMRPERKQEIMQKVSIPPQICNAPFDKFDELVNKGVQERY